MAKKCKKGYKLQDGKCIKKKGFLVSSKSGKSYNPFKMWGSWIGALIPIILFFSGLLFKGIFVFFTFFMLLFGLIPIGVLHICPYGDWGLFMAPKCSNLFNFTFIPLEWAVLGFLIGYGIHSLIRRIRK